MNNNEIKLLLEERGTKAKSLHTLLVKPTLTPEERTQCETLRGEVNALDERHVRAIEAVKLAGSKPVELSTQEQRDLGKFDLGRALRAQAGIIALEGIEKEMVTEGATEARNGGINEFKGIMLPRLITRRHDRTAIRERRAMSATGTTTTSLDQGGQTIASIPAGLMDAFFDLMVFEKAGFTILEDLSGNVPLPRIVAGTASALKTENAAADATSPTVSTPTLSPHRLPSYVDIGEQLIMQSTSNITEVVRRLLIAQVAQTFQQQLFNGSGAGANIKGLLNITGIGAAFAGGAATNGTNANGAAQVWDDWINLETVLGAANIPLTDAIAYLTNFKVRGQAKKTKKGGTSTADSRMIWDDKFEVNNLPAFVTNSIPATLSKGTLTTGSPLIIGHMPDAFVGLWSGLNLELVRDATLATTGQYRLIGAVYGDFNIPRPETFAAIKDIAA